MKHAVSFTRQAAGNSNTPRAKTGHTPIDATHAARKLNGIFHHVGQPYAFAMPDADNPYTLRLYPAPEVIGALGDVEWHVEPAALSTAQANALSAAFKLLGFTTQRLDFWDMPPVEAAPGVRSLYLRRECDGSTCAMLVGLTRADLRQHGRALRQALAGLPRPQM